MKKMVYLATEDLSPVCHHAIVLCLAFNIWLKGLWCKDFSVSKTGNCLTTTPHNHPVVFNQVSLHGIILFQVLHWGNWPFIWKKKWSYTFVWHAYPHAHTSLLVQAAFPSYGHAANEHSETRLFSKTSFCAQNFLLRAHNCSTNLVPCIRLCLQRAECQGRCFLPNFFFPITHFIEGIISWYWSCYRDTSWYQIIAQLKNINFFTVAAACASDSHDLQFALCLSQRDDAVPSTLNWIWAQTEREVVWWADRWDWLVKFLLTKIIIAVPFWPT